MKQLLLSVFLLLFSISLFAQATPVGELRVTDAGTPFGVNIPKGAKIYDVTNKNYWVATDGISSDKTITTAITANLLKILNPAEQTLSTGTGTATTAVVNLAKTVLTTGAASLTPDAVTIEVAGINHIATDAGTNKITITGTEIQNLGYTLSPTQGTVTIDGVGTADAVLPAADATNAGLLLPADFSKLQKINPNDVVGTYTVKQAEVDATFINAGPSQGKVTLPSVYIGSTASNILVSYNGAELKYTTPNGLYTVDTTTSTGVVTFDLSKLPASLYDLITITYIAKL